ncbi:hypothetical protein J3R83DRAFT_9663, partial [Lanmaoa asiatica]
CIQTIIQPLGPTGNECTGTAPFVAVDLLAQEGLAGEIKHVYAHDAESFIWVLVWISLRYDDGKLRKQDRLLDQWLKVDALGCVAKKSPSEISDSRQRSRAEFTR